MNRVTLSILFAVVALIAVLFETTVFPLPLIYIMSAFFLIFLRRIRIYIMVFIFAFIVDSLRVTHFGLTPLFLIGLCAIIFLYEKYSGSDDIIVSSFLVSVSVIIYAHFLTYSVVGTVVLLSVAGIGWYVLHKLYKRRIFL